MRPGHRTDRVCCERDGYDCDRCVVIGCDMIRCIMIGVFMIALRTVNK